MNFSLMKDKDFAKLIVGQAVSGLGSNMQQFALSLYVLATTQSATLFASIVALSILPRLLLSPIAGVFGDWFDRKKTIVRLDLLNGLVIGLAALYFYFNKGLSLPFIYAMVIYLETVEIFFGTSMAGVIPSMIEKDRLFEANSLNSVVRSLSDIIAPMVAASLYGLLGLFPLLVLNSISFIISGLNEMTIRIPHSTLAPKKVDLKHFFYDLKGGLGIIKSEKSIRTIILLGLVVNFCVAPLFSVGIMFIFKHTLGISEIQFGLATMLMGLSSLIGPVALSKRAQKISVGRLTIMVFAISSVLFTAIALVPSPFVLGLFTTSTVPFVMIVSLCFMVGAVSTLVNIAISTMFQKIVPPAFISRTASVMGMGMLMAIPIGQVLIGFALDLFAPYLVLLVFSSLFILATLAFIRPLLAIDTDLATKEAQQAETEAVV